MPARLAANVAVVNAAALDVHRAGHLPATGEAIALPLSVRRDLPPGRPSDEMVERARAAPA